MKERIVIVEWDDASSNSGYYDKKYPENFTPVKTRTVGYFIKKDKVAIIVSQERFYDEKDEPDMDRHIVTIPNGMIRKITNLKEG